MLFYSEKRILLGIADRIQTVTTNLATMSAGTQEMMASIQEIASLSEEAAAGVEQLDGRSGGKLGTAGETCAGINWSRTEVSSVKDR